MLANVRAANRGPLERRRDDAPLRANHRRGAPARAAGGGEPRRGRRQSGATVESGKAQGRHMVVVMQERATEAQIQAVIAQLIEMGFDVHRSTGATRTVIGAVGDGTGDPQLIEVQDGVHEVLRITEPYKLASRTFKPENTVVVDRRRADRRRRGGRHGGPVLGRVRSSRSRRRRRPSSARARRSCAAARSSRAARRTASRASAKPA